MYSIKGIEKLLKEFHEKREREEKRAHNKRVGYAPKCKVCNSEYLDEIEELREEGFTFGEILEELEIDNISLMSLSRHFQNHYSKSQAYKDKQQIIMLENIREAYTKYPFLEDYFKDKDLEYLERFNNSCGFCMDRFDLCNNTGASTVTDGYTNIFKIYSECEEDIKTRKGNSYFFDRDKEAEIRLNYQIKINTCLNCKNQIQEERLNLLERIITYNFLNIAPENKELYFNLLNFDGNPDEFIRTLQELDSSSC